MSINTFEKSTKEVDSASRERFQELLTKLDTQVNRHVAGLIDESLSAVRTKKVSAGAATATAKSGLEAFIHDKPTRKAKQPDADSGFVEPNSLEGKPWFEKIKRHIPAIVTLGLSSICMVAVLVWSFSNTTAWTDPARQGSAFDALRAKAQAVMVETPPKVSARDTRTQPNPVSPPEPARTDDPVIQPTIILPKAPATTPTPPPVKADASDAVTSINQVKLKSTTGQLVTVPIATASAGLPTPPLAATSPSGSNCSGAALALNLCNTSTK
jgi:hypothetical protein